MGGIKVNVPTPKMPSFVSGIANSIGRATGIGQGSTSAPDPKSNQPNKDLEDMQRALGARLPQDQIDPNIKNLKDQQIQQAQQFRSGLPQLQSNMTNQLVRQNQRDMEGGLLNIRHDMARRGMTYSGMNEAKQGRYRGLEAGRLASGISSLNQGLLGAADELDQQALQTSVGIQKNVQQLQDMAYQRALAQVQGQNALTGNMLSTAATVAILR